MVAIMTYHRVNSCIEAEVAIRRNRDRIHTSGNSPPPLENAARSVSSGSGVLSCFRFSTKDLQRTTWTPPPTRELESTGIGLSLGKGSSVEYRV